MFQEILAGTDGSDTARLAIRHAVELAGRLGARLTVVSVHRDEAGAAIARALLRDVENAHRKAPVRTLAVQGAPGTALVGAAADLGCDLVVVGNVGVSRSQWLGANVPRRVSQRARTSVLLVATAQTLDPRYRRVLVGAAGSPTARVAVEAAVALSNGLDAELTAAAVGRSQSQVRRAADEVRARWPALPVVTGRGGPAEALCKLAESGSYDLLVVGSRGPAASRRLRGGVPEEVAHRARTNVLIVRAAG